MKSLPFSNLGVMPKSSLNLSNTSNDSHYVFDIKDILLASSCLENVNSLGWDLITFLHSLLEKYNPSVLSTKIELLKGMFINFKHSELVVLLCKYCIETFSPNVLPIAKDPICISLNCVFDVVADMIGFFVESDDVIQVDFYDTFDNKNVILAQLDDLLSSIKISLRTVQNTFSELSLVPTNLFATSEEYLLQNCPDLQQLTKIVSDKVQIEDNTLVFVVLTDGTPN